VSHARARGFMVAVKTNGVLLQPRAEELAAAGCASAEVSLYGAFPATHDAFTLQPGSFARTVAGIRAATQAGLRVHVNLCLLKSNAAEIEQMLELVGELGVGCGIDPQITARYDGTTSSLDHRLDRQTLLELYQGPLRDWLDPPTCSLEGAPQCSCARSVVAISSTGEVWPCVGAPVAAGNIREQPFATIWRESPQLNWIRGLSLDDFAACKPCPDRAFCRRSSGVVYNNTGNYTGAESWTCMEAEVLHQIHTTRPPSPAPGRAAPKNSVGPQTR
jgi:AdoMet-dependent heme synthase